jgi:hypothetical protein
MSFEEIEGWIQKYITDNNITLNDTEIYDNLEFDNSDGKRKKIYDSSSLKLYELYTIRSTQKFVHAFLQCISRNYRRIFPSDITMRIYNINGKPVSGITARYVRRRETLIDLGNKIVPFLLQKIKKESKITSVKFNEINRDIDSYDIIDALSKTFKVNIIIISTNNTVFLSSINDPVICIRQIYLTNISYYNSILINDTTVIPYEQERVDYIKKIRISLQQITYTEIPDKLDKGVGTEQETLDTNTELDLICTTFRAKKDKSFTFFRIPYITKYNLTVYGFDADKKLVFLEKKDLSFINEYISYYDNIKEYEKNKMVLEKIRQFLR